MKARLALGLMMVCVLAGCGLQVQAEDLFVVTRTGEGQKLTELVNYDGTISCDGRKSMQLPDPLLIDARDFTDDLDSDATAKLHFAHNPRSVYTYTVETQNGTFSFPDTAGAKHSELAQLELFVVQAAATPCGISA
jgi:hypothetical protein